MVQHIGSNFSLPKNIPLLAVAVGRSWGFQILHSHMHRMGGSGAEMHSYVTLYPPPRATRFFLLSPPLSLHALGFCGSLTQGKPPEEKEFCIKRFQFRKSTLMHVSWNVKHKSNCIINGMDLLIFPGWTYALKKATKQWDIILQSFSNTLRSFFIIIIFRLHRWKNSKIIKKNK